MHYFKHSWDELFQDFCLFGDDFICDLLHQRQNTLHPVKKTGRYLVVLVLFLQELKPGGVTSAPDMLAASTNLKRDRGNTEDSLRNWVQLSGVNILRVPCGGRTTYLCEDSAIFNRPTQRLLYRSAHQWSVFL